ncbi:MAG: DUF3224 domain-containing protein [Bryobacterales bacterium]|nr:DUF3224 domain-containing protein [Bryobacterales bacterium]
MRILAILLLVAVAAGAESKLTMQHATGTLEVKITPASTTNPDANVTLARNTLDKTFLGALSGTSKGEMLAALTQTKGSAGYVAIEHVTATLAGRSGSFALQHSGTMSHGAQSLSIAVVPGIGRTDGYCGKHADPDRGRQALLRPHLQAPASISLLRP